MISKRSSSIVLAISFVLLSSDGARGQGEEGNLTALRGFFGRKFCVRESDDGFTQALTNYGIDEEGRALAKVVKPCIILNEKDGKKTMTASALGHTVVREFSIGNPFKVDQTPDSTYTITTQEMTLRIEKVDNGKTVVLEVDYDEAGGKIRVTVGGVTGTLKLKEIRPGEKDSVEDD